MRRLFSIFYLCACFALLALQACNVVGDSVPSDSPNYALDSLRIIPEEPYQPQRVPSLAQQKTDSVHDKALAGLTPPTVKRRKPRQGDAEAEDFIRVSDAPRSVSGTKRTSGKYSTKKAKHGTSAKKNKKAKAKKAFVSAEPVQAAPSVQTKPRFRYSMGSDGSENNTASAITANGNQTGYPKNQGSNSKNQVQKNGSAGNTPFTKETSKETFKESSVAKNNNSPQAVYRGNESEQPAQPTKEELEEQKKLENELRSASKQTASQLFGRSVTIAITGVDSRLGVAQRHADANHVLRIWLDKGEIEVFSVPRGTPVEAGFSSKLLNYLANLRSNKGREAYLKKVGEITGVGKIDYWVELGFSQAMGVMEMLGFKDNAKTALRVLRSRKAFATGDYQRCYNQGQFIRQMILRHFGKSSGFMGGVALRGALGLVETNLKYDAAKAIIEELQNKGFPRNANAVSVNLRPPYKPQIKEIDLSDESAIASLNSRLETKLKKGGYIGKSKAPAFNANKYEDKLETIVDRAERSVKRNPKAAVAALKRVYEQRSWIQIPDKSQRDVYFKKICLTLIEGYELLGYMIDADNVRYFYEQQLQALQNESASK